jgi:hypothetical protein
MDQVNHPKHYGGEDNPYEAIKVIDAWEADFYIGNLLKYVCRAGKKGGKELDDLKKAKWYLDRKIEKLNNDRLRTNFVAEEFFNKKRGHDGGC